MLQLMPHPSTRIPPPAIFKEDTNTCRAARGMDGLFFLFAFVFAVAVYRAMTQSITFDEALTHLWIKDGFFQETFRSPDPTRLNVHLLYTALARLCTGVLGLSEFSLRLPSLGGTLLYLAALHRLCRMLFPHAGLRFLMGALLTLNPFLMDFMPFARGYMLALGLTMTALLLLLQGLARMAGKRQYQRGRMDLAAVLLALAVASNLSFIYLNLAIGGVTFLLTALLPDTFNTRAARRRLSHLARGLIFFILCAVAVALLAPWWKLLEAEQGYGFHSLLESALTLVNLSFNHGKASLLAEAECGPLLTQATALLAPVLLGWMALVFGLALRRVLRERRSGRPRAEDAQTLAILGVLGVSLIGFALSHALFNVFYPRGRTGMFLIVFFTLAIGVAVQWQATGKRAAGVGRCVCPALGLLALAFLMQFQTHCFVLYRTDADTGRTLRLVRELSRQQPERTLTLAATWYLSMSFRFYQEKYRLDRLRISEVWVYPNANYLPGDLYVFDNVNRVRQYQAKLVRTNPLSGTYLAANPQYLPATMRAMAALDHPK